MDLDTCLCKIINDSSDYENVYDKIRAGFITNKDFYGINLNYAIKSTIEGDIRDIYYFLYQMDLKLTDDEFLYTAVFVGNKYFIDKYWYLIDEYFQVELFLGGLLKLRRFKTARYILEKSDSIIMPKLLRLKYAIRTGSLKRVKKLFDTMTPGRSWGLWNVGSISIEELLFYATGKKRTTKFLEEKNAEVWGKK